MIWLLCSVHVTNLKKLCPFVSYLQIPNTPVASMLPYVCSVIHHMTSKCGKNKKVAHEPTAECVTDVLNTFSFSAIYH